MRKASNARGQSMWSSSSSIIASMWARSSFGHASCRNPIHGVLTAKSSCFREQDWGVVGSCIPSFPAILATFQKWQNVKPLLRTLNHVLAHHGRYEMSMCDFDVCLDKTKMGSLKRQNAFLFEDAGGKAAKPANRRATRPCWSHVLPRPMRQRPQRLRYWKFCRKLYWRTGPR